MPRSPTFQCGADVHGFGGEETDTSVTANPRNGAKHATVASYARNQAPQQ